MFVIYISQRLYFSFTQNNINTVALYMIDFQRFEKKNNTCFWTE